jgi:putative RNA 2'-phosphotransferase
MTPPVNESGAFRTLLYALRHAPAEFGLALDAAGWVAVDELLLAVRVNRPVCARLTAVQLAALLAHDPGRFELCDGRVRARYGHSTPRTSLGAPAAPPDVLFHGLPLATLAAVMRDGLRPMGRTHVHLTSDAEYAGRVAACRGEGTVLPVLARQAHTNGVRFHPAGPHVWLADPVPPRFLQPSAVRPERNS